MLYNAGETFVLSAGSKMQIRDNETGEIVNRLNETVPDDKQWSVSISLSIIETSV
jgi:hypothetical protein